MAFPAALNFPLVQDAAEASGFTDSGTSEAGRISDYLFLQNQLRGLLAILGGLVTVGVIEQGALLNAVNALPGQDVPGELIFIFASLLAAGLGVLYLPAFSALQRAGQDMLDSLAPLPSVSNEAFLAACEKRDRLRSILQLDASAKANLESGVLILTPLIGGAVTTFLRV